MLPSGAWYVRSRRLFARGRRFPSRAPCAPAHPLLIKPAIYVAALMRDFYIAGGRVMVREFAEARELMSLRENLIFNCTGLGARTLFHDEELPCVWNAIAIVSMWLF